MKIRELSIAGLRNFPPEGRRIRFVDPYTDEPRTMSVIVGSNGSGKSTVLATIASTLRRLGTDRAFGIGYETPLPEMARLTAEILVPFDARGLEPWASEAQWRRFSWRGDGALVNGTIDLTRDLESLRALMMSAGPNIRRMLGWRPLMQQWIGSMEEGARPLVGGAVVLSTFGRFRSRFRSRIIESHPPRDFVAVPDMTPEDGLMQHWLWQNYLDLEEQAEGRPNLIRFVGAMEELLGQGQRIHIKRGRVTIERPHVGDTVEPHQLPSGEQQILTLFGELLRHLRPRSIILIDEPETSLHPALQRAVVHKLRVLARKHDLQIIMATHSMEIVKAVAPHEVISLDDILLAEGVDDPQEQAG